MRRWWLVAGLVAWCVAVSAVMYAQQPQQWRMTTVGWNLVTVVDAGPVCLYVVTVENLMVSPAVWGISKAHLPAGKGCQ